MTALPSSLRGCRRWAFGVFLLPWLKPAMKLGELRLPEALVLSATIAIFCFLVATYFANLVRGLTSGEVPHIRRHNVLVRRTTEPFRFIGQMVLRAGLIFWWVVASVLAAVNG